MPAQEYHFDLVRIFWGDLPPIFLLEVLFRTVVIYVYTLVLVRVIGKRGMGQLSPFDFVIVIALGSAVGDPMFYDDVPLIYAMAVITLVVALQRGVSLLTENSRRMERFVESDARRLVTDGVLEMHSMHAEQLDREELFSALRVHGVRHLGEVERAYIETSGHISVLRRDARVSGRPLIPPEDPEFPALYAAGQPVPHSAQYSCDDCGLSVTAEQGRAFPTRCAHCGASHWLEAVRG